MKKTAIQPKRSLVWFDMHHYNSMKDPDAKKSVQRLSVILAYTNQIGMGGSLTMLSNQAFKNSPKKYRPNGGPKTDTIPNWTAIIQWKSTASIITPPKPSGHCGSSFK